MKINNGDVFKLKGDDWDGVYAIVTENRIRNEGKKDPFVLAKLLHIGFVQPLSDGECALELDEIDGDAVGFDVKFTDEYKYTERLLEVVIANQIALNGLINYATHNQVNFDATHMFLHLDLKIQKYKKELETIKAKSWGINSNESN